MKGESRNEESLDGRSKIIEARRIEVMGPKHE